MLKFHKSNLISHFTSSFGNVTNSSSPVCNAQFTNTSTYTTSFHSEHNCDMGRADLTIFPCQVRKAKFIESKSLLQGPSQQVAKVGLEAKNKGPLLNAITTMPYCFPVWQMRNLVIEVLLSCSFPQEIWELTK